MLIDHTVVVLPFLFPEFELLNFTGGGFWQFTELNVFRRLKPCNVLFAKINEGSGFKITPVLWNHKGFWDFSPFRIRHRNNSHLKNVRMSVKNIFYFNR